MKRELIAPSTFTPTMGAYSHGLRIRLREVTLVFVTGQIAMDSAGNVVPGGIEVQTRFVFENIRKILECANASFDDVVKAQIFLTNIRDFAKVSPIRNEYFGKSKPASTLVEVSSLVKEGCEIEVEVIAISPNE